MPVSRGKALGLDSPAALDSAIIAARRALDGPGTEGLGTDAATRHAAAASLSTALRYRFLRSGNREDFDESLALLEQVPRPTCPTPDIDNPSPLLKEHERKWVRLHAWLEQQGYYLGARYKPGWVPSWHTNKRPRYFCSDYFGTSYPNAVAALRIEDNAHVWLKISPVASSELQIQARFMANDLRDDPRNHVCPLLDYLRPPLIDGHETWLLVMPVLRHIDQPEPLTIGHAVGMIASLATGLGFLHEHNVAHRDICVMNVMMDASQMIPGGWFPYLPGSHFPSEEAPHQPIRVVRDVPVKYYFVDFGESSMFASTEARRLVVGKIAQNQTVPELSDTVPYDAFKLDVRMFGDLVKQLQMDYPGTLGLLDPIIQAMSPHDPHDRITAASGAELMKDITRQCKRSSSLRPLNHRGGSNVGAWLKYPFRIATAGRSASQQAVM